MLQEYSFIKYVPSVLALSAVCLSLHTFGFPCWTPTIEYFSAYQPQDTQLKSCVLDMFYVYSFMESCRIQGIEGLQGIKEKYSHPNYLNVSSKKPPTTLPQF